MTRTEFITVTTIILFGVFVLGWFASWLIGRLTRPSPADIVDLERKLQQAEQDREAALDGLRESRTEIEELRNYIERKLARR